MEPREVDIPDELKILNRDLNKGIIVIGSKGYEIVAMAEGDLEKIITDIAAIVESINSPDGKCPRCGKVVKEARITKTWQCPDDQTDLITMNQSPVEAILKSGKIPEFGNIMIGIEQSKIKDGMTFNQMRHFAGLFWKLNFSDDGLPKESLENFKKLLEMMGPEKKPSPQEQAKTEESIPAQ